MKITNLSLSLGADTLFKEEASVLMAIVRYGLEKLCLDNLDSGTFLFGYAADDTIGKKCAPEGLIKFKKLLLLILATVQRKILIILARIAA